MADSLAELFDGHSQLIVYHFMYEPDWNAGCKRVAFRFWPTTSTRY